MQQTTGKFYSSLGLLVILNAIIKPLWILGIDREVQIAVGSLEYGRYFSLFNLSFVLSFLLDWGLTAYINRQLAAAPAQSIDHAGHFLFVKLLFAALYTALILLIAFITGIDRWDIVWGVISIQIFTSLFLYFRAMITAHQWFHTDAWLSVIDKALMILLCGSLLLFPAFFGHMTIGRFLLVQSVCTAVAMTIAAGILISRRGIAISFKLPLLSKGVIRSAMPYALIIMLMSVHYRMDGFLLERINSNGAVQAGIYASAYRLLDAANMPAFLFASFLLPYIARQWSLEKNVTPIILDIRHILLPFAIGIACLGIFLAPWIIRLFYRHSDPQSVEVLQWCLPAIIGYSLVHIYGTIMTATGHIRALCGITAIAVTVNLVLNLVFIPSLGAKACCIAALFSQLMCGMGCMVYVRQKLGVPLHYGSLLIYCLIATVLAGTLYGGYDYGINGWLLVSVATASTLLILVIVGLFRPAKWFHSLTKSHL